MNKEKEIWKDIKGYPGYQISSIGNVRSYKDRHGNISSNYTLLKPYKNNDGYYIVGLYNASNKNSKYSIHRLMAITFLGEHPGLVVNHINGIKTDNRIENLEWVTPKLNSTLASEMGLYKTSPIKIIETGETFDSVKDCAKALGRHRSNITHYINGKYNSPDGLHFEYVDTKLDTKPKSKPFLYDYQMDAVMRLRNGSILCGSVGSGKSRSGLFYYFKEQGGWIDENGTKFMENPKDLYIITTAKKRDSLEWNGELAHFLMSPDPKHNQPYTNKIVIDSWNNLPKYKDVTDSFFILDEQRLVSYGAWTKSFLKIAKTNDWIMLSATPADTYTDYLPVFLANGFFKNKTEFNSQHVIFSRYSKYPKIERYMNTTKLDRLRDRILVIMDYEHKIDKFNEDVYCDYDIRLYKDTIRQRWNPYKDEPIPDAGGLCYVLRRIVNSDESRQVKVLEILEKHPKVIIFYNHNYERDILLNLAYGDDVEVAEWTGHKHQPLPKSDKWVYICQYASACEGWEATSTNCIIFFSQNYSYKVVTQAAGRVDRLNTPYKELYYYHLQSRSGIDLAIRKALHQKKKFNERKFCKWDQRKEVD